MFVIGNLLTALAWVLEIVFQTLSIILVVNAVLSWVRPDPSNPIVMLLDRISDAVCNPVRRLFPTVISGIDFAPFIVLILIQALGMMFLVQTLRGIAARMG
jgi:YggT family protein